MTHTVLIKDILSAHLGVGGAMFSNNYLNMSALRSMSKTLIYKMNLSKATSILD